jgi:hypothetical protein
VLQFWQIRSILARYGQIRPLKKQDPFTDPNSGKTKGRKSCDTLHLRIRNLVGSGYETRSSQKFQIWQKNLDPNNLNKSQNVFSDIKDLLWTCFLV